MTPGPVNPADEIARHFMQHGPARLGVAVSGGSDSIALLMLLADWGAAGLHVVTVDHGLREEATREAADVARLCTQLGFSHDVLRWEGWNGQGNLMAAARAARYALLADWAQSNRIADIALGHTQDDLAETLMMRLRRGAGLDGLSAMAARFEREGVCFHRPLLGIARAQLRDLLQERGIDWAEDATNADARFERARVRSAMSALDLDSRTLAETALALRAARDALEGCVAQVADEAVTLDRGDVLIAREMFEIQLEEISRRVMQAALIHVSGAAYGPRGAKLGRALSELDRARTLLGCRIIPQQGHLRVTREWKAVAALCAAPGALWDGRWIVEGPAEGRHVAALGEASLGLCPDRKATGLPAASLMASPAVWEGERLVAAPLAGLVAGYTARTVRKWRVASALMRL